MRISRTEWNELKWGDPRKQCGGDFWNEAKRIHATFKCFPEVSEYLGTESIGTGLWCLVNVKHSDGRRETLNINSSMI